MIDPHVPMGGRLQGVLVRNGVRDRHVYEGFIVQGRVSVDGHVVRELGMCVDPVISVIYVGGIRVQTGSLPLALALYKPSGVISTMYDDMGRPGLTQCVEDRSERLYHVDRPDQDTEGLILLSNDDELTHRLTHPRYEVPKTYIARVEDSVTRGLGRVLECGITLKDGPACVNRFTLHESIPRNSIVEITLHLGRNHIARRVMVEIDHPVVELVRMKFETVVVSHLKPGKTRAATGGEPDALTKLVDL